MKRYAVSIALLMVSAACLARSGDDWHNGGGIAENNVSYAYVNIARFIDLCLDAGSCGLSAEERPVLQAIRAAIDEEKANEGQLIFKSEVDLPGFFHIGGEIKVARTGSQVRDPIFINKDLLYTPEGGVRVEIENAVAILVHELGHHQGVADHAWLDILGGKVGTVVAARISRVDLGPGKRQIQATTIDMDRQRSFAQLLVADGVQYQNLSQKVVEALSCPQGEPGAGLPGLEGLSIFNPHWIKAPEGKLLLGADTVLYCRGVSKPIEGVQVEVEFNTFVDALKKLRIVDQSGFVRTNANY